MLLIRFFLDICLFRKGPQDVPASVVLLKLVFLAYALIGLVLMVMETGWLEAALQVVLEAGLLLGFVWISLKFADKTSRFLQTTIAMMGTDALISGLALPFLAIVQVSPDATFIPILLLALMLWHLAIIAHILRHALSQPLAVGFGLAIVYTAFTYQVVILLFGTPAAAG